MSGRQGRFNARAPQQSQAQGRHKRRRRRGSPDIGHQGRGRMEGRRLNGALASDTLHAMLPATSATSTSPPRGSTAAPRQAQKPLEASAQAPRQPVHAQAPHQPLQAQAPHQPPRVQAHTLLQTSRPRAQCPNRTQGPQARWGSQWRHTAGFVSSAGFGGGGIIVSSAEFDGGAPPQAETLLPTQQTAARTSRITLANVA